MQNSSYNKYSNNPTFQDNIRFASKREAIRYSELKLLERAGEIKDLRLQVPFVLQSKFRDLEGTLHRAIIYISDFMYLETKLPDMYVVEDVKGHKTELYRLKKKLFLYKYPTIIFREIY